MGATMKRKKWRKHKWIDEQSSSGSYIIYQDDGHNFGGVEMKLADCSRTVSWEFGTPGDKRGKKKIAAIKKIIDEMYNYLHEEP